jgi:hypothetical protein
MAEQEELKLIISTEFLGEEEFDRIRREINEIVRLRDKAGRVQKAGARNAEQKRALDQLRKERAELEAQVKGSKQLNRAILETAKAKSNLEVAENRSRRSKRAQLKALADELELERKLLIAKKSQLQLEVQEQKKLLGPDEAPGPALRGKLRALTNLREKEAENLKERRRVSADLQKISNQDAAAGRIRLESEKELVDQSQRRFASEVKRLSSEKDSVVRLKEEQRINRNLLVIAKERARLAEDAAAGGSLGGDPQRGTLSPLERLDAIQRIRNAEADLSIAAKESNKQVKKQNEFFNRLKGTIRGVVVGLVVYRGLTRSIDALRFGLNNAIEFGNALENAELSVAGLIAGASDIATAQGVLEQGADKYAAALRISRNEITEIRKQALGTTATFEQLLTIYQQNVSQALGAGLDLSQFREVALLFSQGATLLGVPQTQLAEEIRSVLQGTVRPRDTRIATALGITNADIRKAKEAGRLFEFIQERFSGIAEASTALSETLPVVVSDLKDGVQIAGALGAQELRDELVRVGTEIRNSLIAEEGQNTFAGFVQRILEPLTSLVGIFDEVRRPLGELLGFTITLIGEFAESLALVLLPFQDLLRIVNLVAAALLGATQVLQAVFGNAFSQAALRIVATTTLLTAAIQGLGIALVALKSKAALATLTSGFAGLTTVFNGLSKAVSFLTLGTVTLNAKLLITVGAFVALTVVIDEVNQRTGILSRSFGAIEKAALGLRGILGDGTRGFLRASAQVGELERLEELLITLRKNQRALDNEQDKGGKTANELRRAVNSLRKEVQLLSEDLTVAGLGVNVNELLAQFDFRDRGSLLDGVTGAVNKVLSGITSSFESAGEDSGDLFSKGAINRLLTREQYQKEFREFRRAFDNELLAVESEASGSLLSPAIRFLADQKNRALEIDKELLEKQRLLQIALQDQSLTTAAKFLLNQQLGRVTADLVAGELARNGLLKEQLKLLAAQADIRETEDLDTQERLAALDPLGAGVQRQREILGAQSAVRENLLEQAKIRERINGTLRDQAILTAQLSIAGLSAVPQDFSVYERRLNQDRQRLRILELQAIQEEKSIERAEKLESLSPALRGVATGIDSITQSLTTENITGNLVQGSFQTLRNGIQNAATTALQAAFTGEAVDFGLLARQLGQELANQLVNALVDKFIFQPILDALSEAFGLQLFNNIALERNTIALTALGAIIQAQSAQAAFGGLGVSATPGRAGILAGIGRAEGGAVSGENALAKAPPGLDPRDTVPAFLRPGEYVATPEMERRAPGLFYALEKLRRGVHSLPNFGKLRNAPRGFATGGPVDGTLRSADSFSGSAQGATVVPVLVTDERGMRKIHDNPQFVAGINKRTNQQAMRTLNRRPMR